MGFLDSARKAIFGENVHDVTERLLRENVGKIKLEFASIELEDGRKLPAIQLLAKGCFDFMHHVRNNAQVKKILAIDVTSQKAQCSVTIKVVGVKGLEPIICALEDFQYENTPFLHNELPIIEAPTAIVGGWEDWVTLLNIPIDALTFPRKGALDLVACMDLEAFFISNRKFDAVDWNLSTVRSASFQWENSENGYIDRLGHRERAVELAVSMAVLTSGVDGTHDASEGEIVKSFINKQLSLINDTADRKETKLKLNTLIHKAYALKDFDKILDKGVKYAQEVFEFDSDLKFMIMELLLDVASEDGVADVHETKFLNTLAKEMGIDFDEYKSMRDKALPISIYRSNDLSSSGEQIEDMLGLTPDMTIAQKKKQLSKEYRKWNALKNSSDDKKSKQAKDMIDAISRLRNEIS